jgi:hypothetical protein
MCPVNRKFRVQCLLGLRDAMFSNLLRMSATSAPETAVYGVFTDKRDADI